MAYAFEHEGSAFVPNGKVNISNVDEHNREQERIEIEWLRTHPDRVFLYVKPADPQRENHSIQTWLGTDVATEVKLGQKARNGFGFHSYRRSVTCLIFGVRYVGWFMQSSGDYCRLRKAKRQ